ncbi:hypothetical protein IPdc08_00476 [archaeon]|nr:hypothetical protein IPdc08_00476 [archaeon]
MQKLLVELKNTSGAPPQVLYSVSEASRPILANNISEEDQHSGKSGQMLSVPVVNMHKKPIPDSSVRNSDQVEIPAGSDLIKNYYFYTNLKRCEVGQFLHPLQWVVLLPRLL